MLRRALPLIVLQYRRDRLLAPQVQTLLRSAARTGHADVLAQALHVSVRTLHRQLREEGASLQGIKDRVRREQAIEQLCRSVRPIKQIALAVGFASEKSFARAFPGLDRHDAERVQGSGATAPERPLERTPVEPALDLRAPVVAPERLAVDDEERHAEHTGGDRRVVGRP
jgi:AraC-like DNA-binding protein